MSVLHVYMPNNNTDSTTSTCILILPAFSYIICTVPTYDADHLEVLLYLGDISIFHRPEQAVSLAFCHHCDHSVTDTDTPPPRRVRRGILDCYGATLVVSGENTHCVSQAHIMSTHAQITNLAIQSTSRAQSLLHKFAQNNTLA